MELVMIDHEPLSPKECLCLAESDLRTPARIPDSKSRWLRTYWADWQKGAQCCTYVMIRFPNEALPKNVWFVGERRCTIFPVIHVHRKTNVHGWTFEHISQLMRNWIYCFFFVFLTPNLLNVIAHRHQAELFDWLSVLYFLWTSLRSFSVGCLGKIFTRKR